MGRIRQRRVSVRLSEKEYRHLKNQADLAGVKIEPFIRSLIMQTELKARPKEEWAELIRQMSAIGNNINQIAHRANIHGLTDKNTLLAVKESLDRLWQRMGEL